MKDIWENNMILIKNIFQSDDYVKIRKYHNSYWIHNVIMGLKQRSEISKQNFIHFLDEKKDLTNKKKIINIIASKNQQNKMECH